MLQIIIAFIPGEPVEILAGVLFGTWGGLLLCMIGSIIASTTVFAVTRRYGLPLVYRLFGREKVENFVFFRDSQKVETAAFLLFLLPGTPKDMLTYIAGVSRIKMSRFLMITTFARIPSIITGTIAGDALLDNWKLSLCVFILTGVFGVIGLRYRNRIESYIHQVSLRGEHRNDNHTDIQI
ncbi:VTT domain-containing protein [Eubacteriales bacterium OttesenSCG-928-A19]|nr:VTT domain-containing protein [Eubacteriales bacterium OttesenSCG-928-A19]